MSVDAGDALKFLNLVGELYAASRKRYAEARRLAEQAGMSKEDRDAADARYAFTYIPPPPGWTGGTTPPDPPPPDPPPPPPPPVDVAPYLTKQVPPVPDDAELLARGYKDGDQVCAESVDSEWMVVKRNNHRGGAPLLRKIGEAP